MIKDKKVLFVLSQMHGIFAQVKEMEIVLQAVRERKRRKGKNRTATLVKRVYT